MKHSSGKPVLAGKMEELIQSHLSRKFCVKPTFYFFILKNGFDKILSEGLQDVLKCW